MVDEKIKLKVTETGQVLEVVVLSKRAERIQVVLYNPPSRRDIVLVATRPVGETAWRPLLRIDMPRATRFDFIRPSWH